MRIHGNCVWIALLVLPAAAAPQEAPNTPVNIRVNVSLVNVSFSVRDARGTLAPHLTENDFEVLEDGVPQKIRFFGSNLDLPLTLGLISDFSVSQKNYTKTHQRDLEAFLRRALGPRDRAFLVCFGNHLRLASDFSPSIPQLMDGLNHVSQKERDVPELGPPEDREGGTAFYDALFYSAQKLQNEAGRRALIVFSDGEDNSSAHHMLDAIETAQSADAIVYAIRYTYIKHGRLNARNKYGMRVMERIARDTGGADFDALKVDTQDAFAEIERELRSLYELGYASTNPTPDGSFRKVAIRVKQPGFTVRSKSGYYAR